LDIEGIDALMAAIKKWNGGCILISHDTRFITTVANELWVCADGSVQKFYGFVFLFLINRLSLFRSSFRSWVADSTGLIRFGAAGMSRRTRVSSSTTSRTSRRVLRSRWTECSV
jgi:energy-coupling factor transporter ATP-binding protein EcfA2